MQNADQITYSYTAVTMVDLQLKKTAALLCFLILCTHAQALFTYNNVTCRGVTTLSMQCTKE